jgi:hypothetical protein
MLGAEEGSVKSSVDGSPCQLSVDGLHSATFRLIILLRAC